MQYNRSAKAISFIKLSTGFITLVAIIFCSIQIAIAASVDNTKIKVSKITGSASHSSTTVKDSTISSTATFNKVNDSIVYSIPLTSTEGKRYKINAVSDDNTSQYIHTSYTFDQELSSDDKTVYATLSYSKQIPAGSTSDLKDIHLKFNITEEQKTEPSFSGSEDSTEDTTTTTVDIPVPNTGSTEYEISDENNASTQTIPYYVIILFSIAIFVIVLIPKKFRIKFTAIAIMATSLLGGGIISSNTSAESQQLSLTISAKNLTVTPEPMTLSKLGTLQQLSNYPEACSSATVGTTATVTDSRDNQSYRIRKLKDGNCWMVDNLKINNVAIESTKSNVPSGTSFNLPSAVVPSAAGTWGAQEKVAKVLNGNAQINSGGYLYNWYAATAGAKGANGSDLMTANSGTAAGDICPKGWRLPDGGPNNSASRSMQALKAQYSTVDLAMTDKSGPQLTFTGHYMPEESSGIAAGSFFNPHWGYYWSRTIDEETTASANALIVVNMAATDTQPATVGVYGGSAIKKSYTAAIRCVSAK